MGKAVFIDRDGTLNEEVHYLSDPDKFSFIKGSIEALQLLQTHSYRIILITNQAGIAKGKITMEQLERIHRRMQKQLTRNGIALPDEDIKFCPHSEEERCECRKPNVKNFKDAERKYQLHREKCWVIGDKTSDIAAGRRGGYRTILVQTGYAGKDAKYPDTPDFSAENLLEAAKIIMENEPM